MSREAKKEWSTARTYSRRVPLYDNEAGMKLLREIARRRGCSVAAAVRQMVREEAAREGLSVPRGAETGTLDAEQVEKEPPKPFWERARAIASSIPAEERERFPIDGSEQLDHYVYGVPKRRPEPR